MTILRALVLLAFAGATVWGLVLRFAAFRHTDGEWPITAGDFGEPVFTEKGKDLVRRSHPPIVIAVALAVLAIGLWSIGDARAQSLIRQKSGFAGTYDLTWMPDHPHAGDSLPYRLVLVLSDTPLADSISRQLPPGSRLGGTRACWRLLNGRISAAPGSYSLDWPMKGDSVHLTLWFRIDAGSRLNARLDSRGLRGELITVGSGSDGNGFRTGMIIGREPISGRRVGEANPSRCLSS